MRVSCIAGDPGYIHWSISSDVEVYLDGHKQSPEANGRSVLTADDEAGVVIYHLVKPGTRGMVMEYGEDGEFIEYYAYGRVEIRGLPPKTP
jgi:hypothetical protein